MTIELEDLSRLLEEMTVVLTSGETAETMEKWCADNNISSMGMGMFVMEAVEALLKGIEMGDVHLETSLHVLALGMFMVGMEARRQYT